MPIKEIRQILMNEMGLTRESIREETRKIVEEVATKFLNNLLDTGLLGSIIVSAADAELRRANGQWGNKLKDYVQISAKEAAGEWIKENLAFKATKTLVHRNPSGYEAKEKL